jgi:hypothetical protein
MFEKVRPKARKRNELSDRCEPLLKVAVSGLGGLAEPRRLQAADN